MLPQPEQPDSVTFLKHEYPKKKFWKPFLLILVSVFTLGLIGLLQFIQNKNIESIFYPVARRAMKIQAEYKFAKTDQTTHTQQLEVYFQTPDAKLIPLMDQLAEQDIQRIDKLFGFEPHSKIPIIVFPNRSSMQKNFGWGANESAIGVYWGGTIQLLSPRVWLNTTNNLVGTDNNTMHHFLMAYKKNSAFAHEYTHYVLDQQLNDNFPRWFTEGVAQYVEYKVQDYQWLDASNSLQQHLYTLQQLTDQFDALPNEALAYRESFMFITFLIDRDGWSTFLKLRDSLAAHVTFSVAIQKTYGSGLLDLEKQWRQQIKKEHAM